MDVDVQIEDNSAQVKRELELDIERVLYSWGVTCVGACVDLASAFDTWTGRPTVDTGRYRAGFGFVTPKEAKMGEPNEPIDTSKMSVEEISKISDDRSAILSSRAPTHTLIIANNVEYAPYLEFGTSRMPARNIMRRAIEGVYIFLRADAEQILKGDFEGISIGNVTGG